jgi:antitoxin HicB
MRSGSGVRARMTDALEYTIVFEEAQDGGWSALAPDLPGLLIAGNKREELLASAPDALATYLEAMRDLGHPVPRPGSRVAQVRVSGA